MYYFIVQGSSKTLYRTTSFFCLKFFAFVKSFLQLYKVFWFRSNSSTKKIVKSFLFLSKVFRSWGVFDSEILKKCHKLSYEGGQRAQKHQKIINFFNYLVFLFNWSWKFSIKLGKPLTFVITSTLDAKFVKSFLILANFVDENFCIKFFAFVKSFSRLYKVFVSKVFELPCTEIHN